MKIKKVNYQVQRDSKKVNYQAQRDRNKINRLLGEMK